MEELLQFRKFTYYKVYMQKKIKFMTLKLLFVNFILLYLLKNIQCSVILQISIPKSGTYLLMKCINLLTKKNPLRFRDLIYSGRIDNLSILSKDYFFFEHLFYNEVHINIELLKKNKIKGIFIYRDPRDLIISSVFWIYKNPQSFPEICNLSQDELITFLIKTRPKLYYNYLGWINDPNFISVKFEKLIGKKGGGQKNIQINEIKKISNYLNLNSPDETINNIADNIFGDSFTFREGKINTWKNYFNESHKKLFKDLYANLLIELKYETNSNW